jgi:signal transduction histidine kinase
MGAEAGALAARADQRWRRVALLAPTRRDEAATRSLFERASIACFACTGAEALAAEVERGVGAVLLTDAALTDPEIDCFLGALGRQAPWSDVPTLLLCRSGAEPRLGRWLDAMRNVTVLERPTSSRTLISSVRTALRARVRQYQLREQFEALRDSEAALRLAQQQLKSANQRKDEFLAMLAHELRNPLAPIRNATEFLARTAPANRRIQKTVDVVKRQVTHLVRLVDDLLDVARITEGRIELQRQPLPLSAVIGQALESVEPLLKDKGHRVSVDRPDRPLYVEGDHARLVQSLSNVLTNAAKYTDPGGNIRLTVESRGDMASVCVSDDGIGMSAELLPQIFDLFVQGDRTLDRSQGGMGIGLSVVKRLVEMHRGSVHAHSEGPDRGSSFEIRLPLIPPPPPGAPASPCALIARRRILIVDDNADAADSLALILNLDGHEAEAVYSSRDALARVVSLRPDVVLLDIGLPEMSGYEVAARIRRTLEPVQIIALTGYGQAEDIRRAKLAGFDAHVLKPVDFELMNRVIATGAPPRL